MTLSEVVEVLAREVDGLQPAQTSGTDAARLVSLFDRVERLGAAGKTLMTARAVECGQWTRDGAHSPQEWLSQLSGVPLGSAQRTLDTAEQLVAQPELAAAVRAGDLSAAQAAEISSAVSENPEAASRLVREAKTKGFKGLKSACRAAKLAAAKSAADDEAMARRQRDSRYLKMWTAADGTGRIDGRLDPISFTRFTSLLHPFEEEAFEAGRKSGTREPTERYRADALLALAEAAGGKPPASPTEGRRGETRAPAKVIVVVDRNALVRGYALDGERCEIEGFGPVPVAVARDIMRDSFLAAVVTDGVDIRRVLHLGRHPTQMQRTALAVRDSCCIVPRCGRTRRLESHHVPDFEKSRRTVLDELALLCPQHHDDVTYHGAKLSGAPGNWQWIPPPPTREFEGPPEGFDPCAGPFDDGFAAPLTAVGASDVPGRDPPSDL